MVQQALPLAAVAGAMAAFADFGRSHEMTAICAAGISQWRVLAMALPVPLLLSLTSFLLAEQLVPTSQLRFAAWWAASEPARGARAAGALVSHRRRDRTGWQGFCGWAPIERRPHLPPRLGRPADQAPLGCKRDGGERRWTLAEVDTMRLDSGAA